MNNLGQRNNAIVFNEGSIFLIRPLDIETEAWLRTHVQDDAQWFGDSLVVEYRYVGDLVLAMQEEGMVVS